MQDGIRIWKFSVKRICKTSVKIYCVATWAISSCSYTDRNLPPPSSSHKRLYSPKTLHRFSNRVIKHKPKLISKGKRQSNFDVLLTVHLSTILVINQLNAQNLVL